MRLKRGSNIRLCTRVYLDNIWHNRVVYFVTEENGLHIGIKFDSVKEAECAVRQVLEHGYFDATKYDTV